MINENPSESRRDWLLDVFYSDSRNSESRGRFQFWKRNFHPIELSSRKFFNEKVHYIHQNPVKAGFVYNAEDFIYSSAANYAGGKGVLDVIVCD